MSLHRRAIAVLVVVFGLLALWIVNAAFWGWWVLDRVLPTVDESRQEAVRVAQEVLGVPVRRACIGVEGDSVRILVAQSEPLSTDALRSLRGRLAEGGRVQCGFPATGVRDEVPTWFEWNPPPERFVERCAYPRHVGRTLVLTRTDQSVLVDYRDYGPAAERWPDEALLAHHWHNCR